MKRYSILTIIPAFALLAVGCSTPTALRTTEYDDMYYSSADKTEFVQPEATAQAKDKNESSEAVTQGGVINPEYSDNSAAMNNYSGDEYYDGRAYDPRDNWYQPNYSFVDPYWGSAYAPVTARHYHMAMAYRDPFYNPYVYDPFYNDPFFYSPIYNPYARSGVSVSMVFGSVWGSPYRMNPYARHYYGGWYPYNNYYNGFYQGYYHGRNQYVYDRLGPVQTRKVQYGPRTERSSIVAGGNRGSLSRPDRGTLSSDYEQQAVRSDNQRRGRPSRTGEMRNDLEGTNTKGVITTRPDATRQARPQRGTSPAVGEQQRSTPVESTRPVRKRGSVFPSEQEQQPVRQEARPMNVRPQRNARERTEPVRTAPARSYERSEVRPAPVRSSGSSSSGSSSGSSEKRSGRPTRGGN